MQKSIIFIVLLIVFAIDIVLLIRMGAHIDDFTFWVPLITLPVIGYTFAKIDFRTGG